MNCFKCYMTTLFKRTWVGLSISYQDKSDLISFLCFKSHLLTALPSAAVSQHSYLYFWNEIKWFSNPITHQINSPKAALGFGAVSLAFGKPLLFAEGSCRCSGAEAGLAGWHTRGSPLHSCRCAPQGVKPRNTWSNFPRNSLFPCRAVNFRCSPPSKLHVPPSQMSTYTLCTINAFTAR